MEIFELKNGVRVAVEETPQYRSAAMGIWVSAGSADETPEQSGVSHFIEHMCFKGTKSRSALDIAAEADSVGAKMNAFTAKECTCYHAKATADKLPLIADILCDIVSNSVMDEGEMEKEKGVVIEEINMTNDTPDDLAHETISELFYGKNPLGKPILGSVDTVRAITRQDIFDYMDCAYSPGRIVISVAGAVKAEDVRELLEEKFGGYRTGCNVPPVSARELSSFEKRAFSAIKKDTEQTHICLALPGTSYTDPRRYALTVVNNAVGGTMSSRLFQKIREERGLAYSVYSYQSAYTGSGNFILYAGTSAPMAEEVTGLLTEELAKLQREGITEREFHKSVEQLYGAYVLSMESTSAKMNQNGKNLTLAGRIVTEEEELSRLRAVTLEDCQAVCRELLDVDALSGAFVGRIEDEAALKKRLFG